jgi:hypothetical protein
MKKKISILFCIFSINAVAQKNTFSMNLGKTFFTSGDLVGNVYGITYGRTLNSYFNLGIEYQKAQSQLKPEEIVPNFITLNDQISSSRILIGPSIEVFQKKLGLKMLFGYQESKKYSNGGIRYLNDPTSGVKANYFGETGRFSKTKGAVLKSSIYFKLFEYKHFYVSPEIGMVKGKANFDWLGSVNFNVKL